VAGMQHDCPTDLILLYAKVGICQAFPAYKLSDLEHEPAADLLQGLRLLDLARKVNA
jgi:hypothetical protein